jgi:hypothetical protein
MCVNVMLLYALKCTVQLSYMFKGWFKCSRVCSDSNVQELVQMFKGWFKCSCVKGERSRLRERLSAKCSKVVLKMALDHQAHR